MKEVTFNCKTCGKITTKRVRNVSPASTYSFCSKSCSGKYLGTLNKKNLPPKNCVICNIQYQPRTNIYENSKTCSKKCLGKLNSSRYEKYGHHAYKNGIGSIRKYCKESCEECGSAKFLQVHHKDEDRTNNSPENLQTLCRRCHHIAHGHFERRDLKTGQFLPK